jgi:hypothetical protein
MNTKNDQVANIASMLVAVVSRLRSEGAPEAIQLAYVKTVMIDQEQVATRDRQPVLQLVNNQLGVIWSFNQIKKAGDFHPEAAPVKVTELTGTANVTVAGQPNEATFIEKDLAGEHVHQEPVTNSTTTAPDQNGQTSSNANEQDTNTMNAQANNTADTSKSIKGFEGAMMIVGRITPEQRAAAWVAYLATAPDLTAKWDAFSLTADQSKSFDENFVAFSEALGEEDGAAAVGGFMRWCSVNQPKEDSHYADKSRFSLMGERDDGIRTSWIAAGSAVVGGGMEMMARGGLTTGSAIGTVVGGIGAFFAGEQVDNMVESQFGRYVVGGMVGLAFGAGGSALGRNLLPGSNLVSLGATDHAPVEALPAPVHHVPAGLFGM